MASDNTPFSCVLIGSDSLLTECGKILLSRGHSIRHVVTGETRVAAWAESADIPVVKDHAELASSSPRPFDYLFSIAYLELIPADVLALPRRCAINFHDGPLPEYAGLNTPSWAILNQKSSHGVTWHEMTSVADAGDILKQVRFDLAPDETSLSVNARCFEVGLASFSELVDELGQGDVTRTPQDLESRTYFGQDRRPAAFCVLDFNRTAPELAALVRALYFGPYPNPLGVAKLTHKDRSVAVRAASVREAPETEPGTVLDLDSDGVTIATLDGALRLSEFRSLEGQELTADSAAGYLALEKGTQLEAPRAELTAQMDEISPRVAHSESRWVETLGNVESPLVPYATNAAPQGRFVTRAVELPTEFTTRFHDPAAKCVALTTALASYLARLSGQWSFSLGYSDASIERDREGLETWLEAELPLTITLNPTMTFDDALQLVGRSIDSACDAGPYLRDLTQRFSQLESVPRQSIGIRTRQSRPEDPRDGRVLDQIVTANGCQWVHDADLLSEDSAGEMVRQFEQVLSQLTAKPALELGRLDLLAVDQRGWLSSINETSAPFPDKAIHRLIEDQVERTPDAEAVVCRGQTVSYRQLNARANQFAAELAATGLAPDQLVAVHLPRSLDLVIAVLAILKAGGAYVPMDPTYPEHRVRDMIEDSGASVVITRTSLAEHLKSDANIRCLCVDDEVVASRVAGHADGNLSGRDDPTQLAYVIYTSGSTGKPKGVMVEHRNVANFFAGMDQKIEHDSPGSWLAVTSLSFDISALELLWTLARGFKVVVHTDSTKTPGARVGRTVEFSVFLWGNDDRTGSNKYSLMLDSARFADQHGFAGVWTPERHFHAFGGPYPNPSVTGAAIAAITSSIQIRCGSCVLPLHHPVRVAEEWSVLDNLSNGRAAIGFASGWMPNDFLLKPENYQEAKNVMVDGIDKVRRLWRGEALKFAGPLGEDVEVVSQPRPIQPEVPFWVTVAGNPETYRIAGEMGADVLTHLLGQTIEEVAGKIQIYREARAAAGFDPDGGKVSLMLHTFVGKDDDEAREIVRGPMKAYLGAATALVKDHAWTFPAFKRPKGAESAQDIDLGELSAEEVDAILEHAFLRYFESSGLFGSVETCLKRIAELQAIGVDDVACMIDYGVPEEFVMRGLKRLDAVRSAAQDESIARDIVEQDVTHMQCTPSMARVMLSDPQTREALGRLQHLMVGGEELPPALATELRSVVSGRITNMYGPTEATIWSSTEEVAKSSESISIGRPITNTSFFVVDALGNQQPPGVPGELWIGGAGVVRGYHNRPELTSDRFIASPFAHNGSRVYRTGDLVVVRPNGHLDFLGRMDHQVKIRGYRVELGEIESRLEEIPDIEQAVVVLREDQPGDQRLVGYLVRRNGPVEASSLRDALRSHLPEFMLPAAFVTMDTMPLTPNGKVSRRALPPPATSRPDSDKDHVAPRNELEEAVAEAWADELQVRNLGVTDDFFELGGHSLLAATVIMRLREQFEVELSLGTLFRLPKPTVELLALHIEELLLDRIDAMDEEEAQRQVDS